MKKIRRVFIRYFVPHRRNGYKPHFLRPEVAGLFALGIVVLFLGSLAEGRLVTSGSSQAAAVVASSLVDLANADRAQNGLPPLSVDQKLQEAAQLKADDMAQGGYFAHTSPSGKDPWYWFEQAGYNFSYAGENLAVYFSDSSDVNSAWMNSPEHRANILNPNYTQIGIATANGMYQGVETTFVVQEFGTPAAIAVAQPPAREPAAKAAPQPPPAKAHAPEVAGASSAAPPKVVAEDASMIAVKNENAAPASPPQPAARANPVETFLLEFVTSPERDLTFAYGGFGLLVALALILEIGVEMRRQHPHRIAIGVSLVALMAILVYVDHSFLIGTVLIA